MPVLPALSAATYISGQTVLVPGPESSTTQTATAAVQPYVPAEISIHTTLPRIVTTMPPAPVRPRRRWIGAVLGGVLAALVLIFGGGLALNLLPNDLIGSVPLPASHHPQRLPIWPPALRCRRQAQAQRL